jgi:hypothetical protein
MQADPLLHEALANQGWIAGFDSNCGSSADAIEESVAIEHWVHAEFGEQFAIELAGDLGRTTRNRRGRSRTRSTTGRWQVHPAKSVKVRHQPVAPGCGEKYAMLERE